MQQRKPCCDIYKQVQCILEKMTTYLRRTHNTNGMFHPPKLQHQNPLSMSTMGRRLFEAIRESHMMQVGVWIVTSGENVILWWKTIRQGLLPSQLSFYLIWTSKKLYLDLTTFLRFIEIYLKYFNIFLITHFIVYRL
mgnify:CR=1 FL=1